MVRGIPARLAMVLEFPLAGLAQRTRLALPLYFWIRWRSLPLPGFVLLIPAVSVLVNLSIPADVQIRAGTAPLCQPMDQRWALSPSWVLLPTSFSDGIREESHPPPSALIN